MRTQVAIVGAGPAGLLLSHLLDAYGVESVVLENRSEEYVLARIRAGILEQSSVEVLTEHGLGDRLARSEEHTSELQSHVNLVCRLLLEKKKKKKKKYQNRRKKERTIENHYITLTQN